MRTKLTTYLECQSLTVGYKNRSERKTLLDNLNLKANSSEIIGLIGENGAGKSTLLRSLMGMLPIISGKVLLHGKDSKTLNNKDKAQFISYVEASSQLPGNLRVYELVAYGRYPYSSFLGKADVNAKERQENAMVQMNILHLADRQLHQISDGEKQRCMIARALAQDTSIILLDEPAAHLDIANRYELMRSLRNLADTQEKTIILSSHDLDIMLNHTDKLWMIQNKGILAGAPEDFVISGDIQNLVSSKDMIFSKESGKFNMPYKPVGSLFLEGSGLSFNWTEKALKRIGYKLECNKTGGIHVIVRENDECTLWEINNAGTKETFTSIETLISYLKLINYECT